MNNGIKIETESAVIDIESRQWNEVDVMDVHIKTPTATYQGIIGQKHFSSDKCKQWATAIAMRLADESDYSDDTQEKLYSALVLALQDNPLAIDMLIGTEVIEETYFEGIDPEVNNG